MHCGGVGPLSLSERVGKLQCKANELSVFLIFACIPQAWQERVNLIKINGEKEWDKSQYEYSLCLYTQAQCVLLPALGTAIPESTEQPPPPPTALQLQFGGCSLLPQLVLPGSGVVRRGKDDTVWCA